MCVTCYIKYGVVRTARKHYTMYNYSRPLPRPLPQPPIPTPTPTPTPTLTLTTPTPTPTPTHTHTLTPTPTQTQTQTQTQIPTRTPPIPIPVPVPIPTPTPTDPTSTPPYGLGNKRLGFCVGEFFTRLEPPHAATNQGHTLCRRQGHSGDNRLQQEHGSQLGSHQSWQCN
jgi:hypothetical protein